MYVVYKTTNKINGKIYIGCHKTSKIRDFYLGSGSLLKERIKKYGEENFIREDIKIFEDGQKALDFETSLVTKEFVSRDDTYNISVGGGIAFYPDKSLERKQLLKKAGVKGSLALKEIMKDPEIAKVIINKRKITTLRRYGAMPKSFKGRKHTEETRKKISAKAKVYTKGKGNSQYGTCWIYNLELKVNKKIKKKEVDKWLGEGWIKGRKMKF